MQNLHNDILSYCKYCIKFHTRSGNSIIDNMVPVKISEYILLWDKIYRMNHILAAIVN